MDGGCKDPAAVADLCVPGWTSKTVSRADQAFFKAEKITVKGVLYRDESVVPSCFRMAYVRGPVNDENLKALNVTDKHMVFDFTFQALSPLSNIDEKLKKERANQQVQIEKTIKNWISATAKAKAKAAKSKKAAAGAGAGKNEKSTEQQAANVIRQLGLDVPETIDEQLDLLQQLADNEARLETVIESAKNECPEPKSIPITRLPGEDDKSKSARAKAMHDALKQAQQSPETTTVEGIDGHLGLQAVVLTTQSASGGTIKTKKSSKSKNEFAKDVFNQGKHMLK